MSKAEFMGIMETLKSAYGSKFQDPTKEVVSTWYNCLSDFDGSRLIEAANRYIKDNQYPPTIADLRETYRNVPAPDPYSFEERFKEVAPDMIAELLEAGLITADGGVDYGDLSEVQFKALREAGAI